MAGLSKLPSEIMPAEPARLPALPAPEMSVEFLARLKEIVETLVGSRGSGWDRAVTLRELNGGQFGSLGIGGAVPATYNPATGQIMPAQGISIDIDQAIRDSAAYKALLRRIGSAESNANLPDEIQSILAPQLLDLARERRADLRTVESKLQSERESFAYRLEEVTASIGKAAAGVRTFTTAYADDLRSLALQVTQLSAELEEGGGSIELEERLEVLADAVQGLLGQWSIKIQTNPTNGQPPVIAGIALSVEDPIAGPGTSALVFLAEKFGFYTNNGASMPFGIVGDQIQMNGFVRIGGTTAQNVESLSGAQSKADSAANWAVGAAATYAAAQAELARLNAAAYADGIVDAEEARAIADATDKANAAKAAAIEAAALDATNKAAPGVAANNALPGINAAINDKLSKTSASQLAATVTLATNGTLLAGTPDNGVYMTPVGLYCVQGGMIRVAIPISGDPTFAGKLMAAFGSFGILNLAAGGSLRSGPYIENGYRFPDPGDMRMGFYFGEEGCLWGNPNTGRWFQIENGNLYGPGFTIINGVPTFTGANIVNPNIDNPVYSPFSVSIGGDIEGGGSGKAVTIGTRTASVTGSGNFKSVMWTVTDQLGDGSISVLNPTSLTASFRSNVGATPASTSARVTCAITGLDGRTATDSVMAYGEHM